MKEIDWDTITITDGHMFGEVFCNERLCRGLLERILNIKIGRIVYLNHEQQLIPEFGARGIRMDVYVADEDETVYNVEMQNANEHDLAKRSRYYQSSLDVDCIKPGMDFTDIRDSYVIFMCTFDPFGSGLSRYTVTPHCKESGGEIADGAVRIFINARAWDICDNPDLKPFLRYLCGDIVDNDEFVQEVDEAVRKTRNAPEWRRMHMRLDLLLNHEILKAQRKGLEEGRAAGLEEGRAAGLEEGRAAGLEEGRAAGRRDERATIAQLMVALENDDRLDELAGALEDQGAYNRLLCEFGLQD